MFQNGKRVCKLAFSSHGLWEVSRVFFFLIIGIYVNKNIFTEISSLICMEVVFIEEVVLI